MPHYEQAAIREEVDNRRAARHRTRFPVLLEHLRDGDMRGDITNISAHGFMIENCPGLERGDRVNIRLPVVGVMEAYVIWTRDDRAGFQLERIIALPDFIALLDEVQDRARIASKGR